MRMRGCFLLSVAFAVVAVAVLPPAIADEPRPEPSQGADDWPMYGGSASHTFSNAAVPRSALGLRWAHNTNATANASVAVVSNGFVYLGDTWPAGSPQLRIRKIDQATGSSSNVTGGWEAVVLVAGNASLPTATTAGPPRSLAVDGGLVYALFTASDGTSSREALVALHAGNGSFAWAFRGTDLRSGPPRPTRSAPVLASNTENQRLVVFGSEDGKVYALNANNGTINWWYDTGASVRTAPAIFGERVYVASGRTLHYLDIDNMTVDGDQGSLVGATPGNADPLHAVDAGGPILATPVVQDPFAYVATDTRVFAVDHDDAGVPTWAFPLPRSEGSPALLGDFMFLRDATGRVYGLDRLTGVLLWARPGQVPPRDGEDLAALDGRLFLSTRVSGAVHDLVVLDASDGSILDRNTTARTSLGSPVAAQDMLFVTEGRRLLAFRGRPELAVNPSDVSLVTGNVVGNIVRASLSVAVRNEGDEPVAEPAGVRLCVYAGDLPVGGVFVTVGGRRVCRTDRLPTDAGTWRLIGEFLIGTIKDPLKAGARSAPNVTVEHDWIPGRAQVQIIVDTVLPEATVANNAAVATFVVHPGPERPVVVGAGPYWVALLLGFLAGVAILYLPLRRLKELRRKEEEKP